MERSWRGPDAAMSESPASRRSKEFKPSLRLFLAKGRGRNPQGLADWMNTTAFDAVCNSLIKEVDRELEQILSVEHETLNLIDQDASAVHSMAKVQGST